MLLVDHIMNYARYPIFICKKETISIINLIYSPDTYRLILKMDDSGNIIDHEITGFKISDPNILTPYSEL